MLKQFVSIILFSLLALQSFYPLAIFSYYYGNKDYIANVLCENKSKPALHCNGKCFLKKQLKKAEKQQHEDKASLKEIQALVYLVTATFINDQQNIPAIVMKFPTIKTDSYSFLFTSSCFRPPGECNA